MKCGRSVLLLVSALLCLAPGFSWGEPVPPAPPRSSVEISPQELEKWRADWENSQKWQKIANEELRKSLLQQEESQKEIVRLQGIIIDYQKKQDKLSKEQAADLQKAQTQLEEESRRLGKASERARIWEDSCLYWKHEADKLKMEIEKGEKKVRNRGRIEGGAVTLIVIAIIKLAFSAF